MRNKIIFIIIQLYCILIGPSLLAQPFVLVLDGPETGNQIHQARESITFAPGYSYSPNGGTMVAEIIDPIIGGGFEYSTVVDPSTYSINTSLPVGILKDEIQVTGNLNYSSYFEVPKGAGGLQPSLGLNYKSDFNNDLLGVGFNLVGLSTIDRVNRTHYIDGTSLSILGTQNDAFSIDGKRLLLVSGTGTYGTSGSVYGTEMEEFSKIVAVGSSGSGEGPLSFIVYTKSGLILEYGNTSDSRVLKKGTTVLSWKLNKVTDRFNNSIVYTYYEYDDEQPIYSIEYNGGNSEINFRYKQRSDVSNYIYGGKEFTANILLEKIEINNNGQSFKKYEFSYVRDNYSQLQKITEYSSSGQQMNPTVFAWTHQTDVFNQTTHYSNSSNERYFHGDFNGDGITDFVAIPDKSSYTSSDKFSLYIGSTTGSMVKKVSINLKNNLNEIVTGDFNGDGKTDLVMVYSLGTYYTYYESTGEDFTEINSWSISEAGYIFRTPVDYNGDGKLELFLFNPQHQSLMGNEMVPAKYKLYTAAGAFIHEKEFNLDEMPVDYSPTTNKIAFSPDRLFDYNGDGRTDIIQLTTTGFKIYEFKTTLTKTVSGSNFNINNSITFGDFNGDGISDILKTSGPENPVWSILFYTQNGFKEKVINGMPSLNLWAYNNDYVCLDFNADGKMDIITWGKGTNLSNSTKRIFLALNKGNGYEYEITEYTSPVSFDMALSQYGALRFYFGDYNGDGRQQFFYKKGSTSKLFSFGSGTPSNLVNNIINGHGAKTTVSYLPMTNSAVYTKGSSAVYPVIDAGSSFQLVSSVAFDNGTASATTISYTYNGAKVHLKGKGFLGFSKTTAVNSASGVTTESNFDFDLTNYYPQISSVLTKKGSTLLSTNTYEWQKQTISGKRIFPFIYRLEETNNLTGQSLLTSFYYNTTYGNLQKVIKNFGNGYTLQSVYSYTNEKPNEYLVGRVTAVNETNTRGGVTTTAKVGRIFSATSNMVTSETYNSGDASSWALTKEYDTWGNMKKASRSASGIATSIMEYTYDSSVGVNLEKVKDVNMGNETTYTWYPATGLLHEETDPFGNKVTYTYNNADQVATITPTTGVKKTLTRSYNVSGGPSLARFYVYETGLDNTASKVWFDKTGKEIRTENKGFSGSTIKVDKVYLSSGLLQKYSEPSTSTPSYWNTYSYNTADNRISSFTPKYGPSVSYSYSPGLAYVNKTVNGQTYTSYYYSDGSAFFNTDPGGNVIYDYLPTGELKEVLTPENMTTTMTYDKNGNRLTLSDPSSGTITNTWYGTGQQKTMINASGKLTTWYYQPNGLLDYFVTDGQTTDYSYNSKGQVTGITSPGGVSRTYDYYTNGHLKTISESIGGVSNTVLLEYDSYGRLYKKTFNGSDYEQYSYQNGYLYRISFNGTTVWQATTIDEYARVRAANVGSTSTTWGYNSTTNLISQIKGTSVQQYDYNFNGATGNLTSRTNTLKSKTETFGYDTENLDRLTSVTGSSAQTLTYQPGNKGNILTKSDAGTYAYDPSKKYAVTGITNGLNISTTTQNVTYNAFNKVQTISEGTKAAEFEYNADRQRIRMTLKTSGATTKTRWYFGGSCEREQVGSTVTQYIWIGGDAYTAVAVAKKVGTGNWTVYNIFRDHLGTITHLKTGSTISEYSFDAWGRRRDKDTWSYTLSGEPALLADRGFTAHEFLADFNLYNMNGRLYDPVVGRFFSPDPFVQDASFSQSYNRYSYCLNNPLKFTDYSGNKWNWNRFNPFHWFDSAMQWINDKTPKLRQKMANAGIPDFRVGYSSAFGPGFSIGDNPMHYPVYEGRIGKGEQNISAQLAGFSSMGWQPTGFGDIVFNQQFVGESPLANGIAQSNRGVSLLFNGLTLSLMDNGKTVFSAPAVSGRPLADGSFDYSVARQKMGSTGPIPVGNYKINPQATQWWTSQSFMQRTAAIFHKGTWPGGLIAWGVARTWITPDGANVYGRSGFTIHGGFEPGSAGCIDLYGRELDFFRTLQNYRNFNSISLQVKY